MTIPSRTAEVRAALENAEQARELLRDQATKDGLTGLWNRRTVFEILSRELTRFEATGAPLCILMVDADHFKGINDSYGDQAGDRVIQCIAGQLRSGLRQNEAIGRYIAELVGAADDALYTAKRA